MNEGAKRINLNAQRTQEQQEVSRWKLTRLKSPFGRLLHLFLVPECDFNLGYQSADEVINDLEPERKPTTAFSMEVVEVKNMGERNGSRCQAPSRRVFRIPRCRVG
jgi:hypothetical protein